MLRTTRGPGLGPLLLQAALGLGRAGWHWPASRAASGGRGRAWLQPTGRETGVQVYNSLTGRKEPLIVAHAEAASWYSCGPTVYDHAHLGHACSYVRFDIIRRILTKVFGCNIVMVMGITDVDDKIITRANEMNISPASLASLYEEDFKQDMAALKVLPPTVYLRVTENIPQIISFIEGIVARGHAYSTAKGNVYFDLKARGDKYGKLVGVVPGPAGEPADSDKRHASDFALWKAAKPQEVFWASPWGPGRPGWHIECSAIASMVFGSQLDIHSGGIDLAFPHHENEIAQCEVFHQCEQWGNYFLHSAINYSDSAMLQAQQLLLGLGSFLEDARAYMKGQLACGSVREAILWERLSSTKRAVKAALADDFDTPRVIDAILDLAHHGNGQLRAAPKEPGGPRSPAVFGAIISYFEQFFETVGISLANQRCVSGDGSEATLHGVVDELVRFRQEVRQFALAMPEATGDARRQQLLERQPLLEACDTLRRGLTAHGINIKDRSSTTSTWELLDQRTKDQKSAG
ncbi:probable cysteine--tRNA ligase, mitochondrial isoform X3 [Hylobates moloch]|uniref:probable cysteine--tRNA ligase, mitochondrial isoform X3 n=1 Tax=Hylobates moloch TaxID=81572 RepID=UPI0026763E70|nr:probable cysteine--tRNA ligase, mitochondrial isoform X3 [Hylobates moloch]